MIGPVLRLTLRALLLQKRTIMLALICLAPVLTALIYALAKDPTSSDLDFYSGIVQQLFVPTVAAVIALVFGVSAFGDEREDGTILYLVATPQPRIELVAAKVAAACGSTLPTNARPYAEIEGLAADAANVAIEPSQSTM